MCYWTVSDASNDSSDASDGSGSANWYHRCKYGGGGVALHRSNHQTLYHTVYQKEAKTCKGLHTRLVAARSIRYDTIRLGVGAPHYTSNGD
jgi:hypothetical protein